MSQPFDRTARIPAPRAVDKMLDEFWVENPWEIAARGHNLSGFERNRLYLNNAGQGFDDISTLSGADSRGDGRAVVAADFNHDGGQDLVVRQSGGGPLEYYENRMQRGNWSVVSLRGVVSNRFAIGAQVTAYLGERTLVRELFPHNGFMSQGAHHLHFGLGTHTTIPRLRIRWPSGVTQEYENIEAGRNAVIHEGRMRVTYR